MWSTKPHGHLFVLLLFSLWIGGCAAPKYVPQDLDQLKSAEELGLASKRAYLQARDAPEKKKKLRYSHAGILYSDKCLKKEDDRPICLFYNVVNRGVYLQNHFPGYQKALKIMIGHCHKLIALDPDYQNAGCYRILGDIYAKVPSFSLSSEAITRDLDKSLEYLQKAVELAPNYALNHLFLAQTQVSLGDRDEAREQLKKFDELITPSLDKDYPGWKKDREKLARKLH